MTPEARIAATIELFDQVRAAALSGGAAADNLIRGYFRQRRYAGSKDRRTITENIYAILHDYEALAWRVESCGGEISARSLVIAWRVVTGGNPAEEFTGEGYGVAALDGDEKAFCGRLGALRTPPPELARLNCPKCLEPALRARFGEDFSAAMENLNRRGRATFRVNSLKMSREAALKELGSGPAGEAQSGLLTPTIWSPWGFTLARQAGAVARQAGAAKSGDLRASRLFKNGTIEIQNEASQIASLLVQARPGMQVLDLCAGAGGKSLTLAVCMENKGQIYAADINARRLGRLKDRYRRAGARNIQTILLPEDNAARDAALGHCLAAMDRVVVDAPCSGTGTWKHSPELRLRTDADWLKALVKTQAELLTEAATYLKPGGRMVYMTCSLLAEENEAQVEKFLASHENWSIQRFDTVWLETGSDFPLDSHSKLDGTLQLGPTDGLDGFFVAILKAP